MKPENHISFPESVGECEGMNAHIPKWAPTLEVGVLMDFRIFKEQLHGSKLIVLKKFLYHWKKLLRHRCLK